MAGCEPARESRCSASQVLVRDRFWPQARGEDNCEVVGGKVRESQVDARKVGGEVVRGEKGKLACVGGNLSVASLEKSARQQGKGGTAVDVRGREGPRAQVDPIFRSRRATNRGGP